MRQALAILGIAFLIITICMIYLVRSGVSLRTEPYIKPSPIDEQYENIVYGLTHRMFASFKDYDYMVIGWDVTVPEQVQILARLEEGFEEKYERQVTSLAFARVEDIDWSQVANCARPCWIYLPTRSASDVSENSFASALPDDARISYFTLTVLPFSRDMTPEPNCITQKRLSFDCVAPVSVREVYRKLKRDDIRYFFMRRYNERDHFLFLETRRAPVIRQ